MVVDPSEPSIHHAAERGYLARAADESGMTKLTRAGANRVVSPYAIGGHRLALLILSPRW